MEKFSSKSRKIRYILLAMLCSMSLFSQRPTIGGYTVYYGDIHNHSNVSDGTGTPASAYNYARNTAKLDFFSLADHSGSITSTEWNDIKNQANTYNLDGTFTALWGFEWSSSGVYGHVAVLNTDDYCTTSSPTNTFAGLCSWLASRDCVAFLNHPGRENAAGTEFSHFTTTPSDKVVGMELWNKGDKFSYYYYNDGYYTNDNNKSYIDEAITRGWKIGASGAGDNHSGTWGTAYPSRLAVLANNLTRAEILEAMRSRRFYSTLDQNIALSFKMNGQEMGSSMIAGTYNIQIQASDGDGEIFTEVKLFDKNHNVAGIWTPNTSNVSISTTLNTSDGDYYYIKVKQADAQEAISSPVWISGTVANQPPTCSILSPVSGTTYMAPANIIMEAIAADSDGSISSVEFFQGATKLGEDLTSPYNFTWSNAPEGVYNLTVKATDNAGATVISQVVSITVNASVEVPMVVSQRIRNGNDDAEENKSGGVVLNSDDIEMVKDGNTIGNQTVGLRFSGVNIPQGATITKAYIQFTCDEKKTGGTVLSIRGEASDNSNEFTTASKNISARMKTAANTTWNVPIWKTVGAATVNEQTPELKAIIQEIVNRSGFTTASAISFIITGTGTRTAESFEGSASQSALLHVEYVTSTLKSSDVNRLVNNESVKNTVTTKNELTVYPNPAKDDIIIKFSEKGYYEISVFNVTGANVLQAEFSDAAETILNISEFKSGVYLMVVKSGETIYSKRFIKN